MLNIIIMMLKVCIYILKYISEQKKIVIVLNQYFTKVRQNYFKHLTGVNDL